jgi:predicted RND superfamily exporter protein
MRMNEGTLKDKRLVVVERIRQIVIGQKFKPDLVGGVFMLQGRLAELVNSSLISGGLFLNGVILVMTWFLSRSWRVAGAMLASLYFVPSVMFGILGLFRVPLDVISAPAVNLAIGMGVDSMIHMVVFLRRRGLPMKSWISWAEARANLFEPIVWSTLVVCAGFLIFVLSTFPPTQRFGASVVLGTVLTPFGALFILPYLAGGTFPSLKKGSLSN